MKIVLYFIFILILSFYSCKKSDKDVLKSYVGKRVQLSSLDYCKGEINLDNIYKMILYIDSTECTPCSLENNILLLNDYKNQMADFNIGLIVVLNIAKEQMSDIVDLVNIDSPIYTDSEGEFYKQNVFFKYMDNKTIVLDGSNRIIWIGSPVQTEQSWFLFQKMMNEI